MFRHCFFSLCLGAFVFNGLLLRAEDQPKSKAQLIKTERVDFPAGGTLRLNNSVGEVTVEGWDQPQVEITTIKTTRAVYGPQGREKATRDLDKVRIMAERRGNEVVVTTEFPRYAIFPPPLPWRSDATFDLEYRISAPRNASLVIDHDAGEVHVDDLESDIHVKVLKGTITLRLPEDNQYGIDAKADAGGVLSDFPGQMHRRLGLLGYRFSQKPSATAHNLYLRVGFGDIAIVKIRKPPYAKYVNPPSSPQQ